jgi:glutathione-specific gamma-glutamylcyclotransferase
MAADRRMALTPELVACVHRVVADAGPRPGTGPLIDEDYDRLTDELLASPHANDGVALFAYGSLIWKPACAIEGHQVAILYGWRRAFCLRLSRYRGTLEYPGLMMALDRGGCCRGVLQQLGAAQARASLGQVLRREMSVRPFTNTPRWVMAEAEGARRPAIAFVMDRTSSIYVDDLPLEETAEILARACGHIGSCAEYLLHTVAHLEALGIHDRYLWKLQELVAEKISAAQR